MKRNSATTRGLVEFNGQQEQEEVRDAVADDPSDAGEGSTGTKRGASKKYRTRQDLQGENVYVLCWSFLLLSSQSFHENSWNNPLWNEMKYTL